MFPPVRIKWRRRAAEGSRNDTGIDASRGSAYVANRRSKNVIVNNAMAMTLAATMPSVRQDSVPSTTARFDSPRVLGRWQLFMRH